MKTRSISLIICFLCIFSLSISAQEEDSAYNWFTHNANIVWAQDTRYGPAKANNLYLEYELMGRQNIFDFYGYIDIPKTFGAGKNIQGIWDKDGGRLFADLQARMSINGLFGKGANNSLLKEYFVATNYIGNFGSSSDYQSAHSFWYGLGATVNTYSKFNLDVNFYLRKTFTNYGSGNEHSWKGYRLKLNWSYPICSLFNGNGALNYNGFGDYDFGLDKRPEIRPSEDIGSNDALQVSNAIGVSYKRVHSSFVARYWYHGGENRYNGGSFPVNSTGWGYYFLVGFRL